MKRSPLPLLLTLLVMLALLGVWWQQSRAPVQSGTISAPKLATRGDLLLGRLEDREGTLLRRLPLPDPVPRPAGERLASFLIQDGKLVAAGPGQEATAEQKATWQALSTFLPTKFKDRHVIEQLDLWTDGVGGGRGWAARRSEQATTWQVTLDPAERDFKTRLNTFLHLSAHLLALDPAQFNPINRGELCTTSQVQQGCLRSDAYLNRYMQTFWQGALTRDWAGGRATQTQAQAAAFFKAHPNQFFSVGATKGPEEDFAESWTAFVLSPRPLAERSVKDRKIIFFYSDPQLVRLRLDLLRRVGALKAVD